MVRGIESFETAVGTEPTTQVEALVKSRQRVSDHGEVFTPGWMVEEMLDLVRDEASRIDSRFLEPACGSGNFLKQVLRRKLKTVFQRFGKSIFEVQHQSLLALMSIYGIELLEDNAEECRTTMLDVFADALGVAESTEIYRAAQRVLETNIVLGDALTMLDNNSKSITFAEWGYLGKGKYQRRDFLFEVLKQTSAFTAEDTLFANLGRHEIFISSRDYPAMTIGEIANGNQN
jgi:hypothetical protein